MLNRFAYDALKTLLSVSLATASLPVFAAKAENGPPSNATGGGGSIPPKYPPTTYWDGEEGNFDSSGGQDSPDKNKNSGEASDRSASGKFGEVFRPAQNGEPEILFLGYANEGGVYVYKKEPRRNRETQARRGLYREGTGIAWEPRTIPLGDVLKDLHLKSISTTLSGDDGGSKPPEPPKSGGNAYGGRGWNRTRYEFGQYFGEQTRAENGMTRSVYYEGWRDDFGRVRVFSKFDLGYGVTHVRRGYVGAYGQNVNWFDPRSNLETIKVSDFRDELKKRGISTERLSELPIVGGYEKTSGNLKSDSIKTKQPRKTPSLAAQSGSRLTGDLFSPIFRETGQAADGRKIYETLYRMGLLDPQGRELVFAPMTSANGQPDFKIVREGTLAPDGTLVWVGEPRPLADTVQELRMKQLGLLAKEKAQSFRRNLDILSQYSRSGIGSTYPNYEEAKTSKAPLPRSQSLTVLPQDQQPRSVTPRQEAFRPASKYPAPQRNTLKPVDPQSLAHVTGGLMESRMVKVGNTQQTVFLQGQRDAQGRDLIFRPDTTGGKVNVNVMRTGVLSANGIVVWDDGTISRAELVRRLKAANLSSLPEPQRALYLESLAKLDSADIPNRQKLAPDYREFSQDKSPLPRDKSLTLVPGQNAEARSPRTSRYTGAFQVGDGYRDVYQDNARPSRLGRSLEWSSQKAAQVREILNGVKNGYQNVLEKSPKTNDQALDNLQHSPKTLQVAGLSFAFYSALGIAAAYNLMLDYPNNPNAWDAYLETLTNPAGYAALGAFLLVAAPFLRYAQGVKKSGHYYRQIPVYAGGLMIATWASTAAAKFAQDSSVRKCLGFVNNAVHARFEWDMAACETAYDRWTTSSHLQERLLEITEEFLPTATSMLAALAIYKGLLTAGQKTKYLANKTTLMEKFQKISLFKNPTSAFGRGVLNLGYYGISLGVFMGAYYLASSDIGLGLETRTKNWMLADHGLTLDHMLPLMGFIPGTQHYAYDGFQLWLDKKDPLPPASVSDAEDQLLSGWSAVKSRNWEDPRAWPTTCRQIPGKPWYKFTDCVPRHNFSLSFYSLLHNHHYFQNAWRNQQMQSAFDLFKEWKTKTNDYNGQVTTAYVFYQEAVDRILHAKTHEPAYPPIPAEQESFFSGNALEITGKSTGIPFDPDFNGVWRYVETPTQRDFLFTSLACGPEVEGQSAESLIDKVTSFLTPLTGQPAPQKVLKYNRMSNVRFYPPRIVSPLINEGSASICEKPPGLFGGYKPFIGHTRYAPLQLPISVDGKRYADMGQYILNNVRPTVINGNENRLEDWWNRHTSKEIDRIQAIIRQDYENMLQFNYKTGMERNDYYHCATARISDPALDKYLVNLEVNSDTCAPNRLHRLAYGVAASLRDETRLYLAMLIDLYVTSAKSEDREGAEKAILKVAKEYMEGLEDMLADLKEIDPSNRTSTNDKSDRAVAAIKNLKMLADGVVNPTSQDGRKLINFKAWSGLLVEQIEEVFFSYVSFYSVLTKYEADDRI
jgi:hypothetical protein